MGASSIDHGSHFMLQGGGGGVIFEVVGSRIQVPGCILLFLSGFRPLLFAGVAVPVVVGLTSACCVAG